MRLLQKAMEEVSALEDNFWKTFNREASRAGFPTAPEAQVDEWTREFDASAGIKTEQDAAIGSDGAPLSTTAARRQTTTRRPLFDAATEADFNAVVGQPSTNSTNMFDSDWGRSEPSFSEEPTMGERDTWDMFMGPDDPALGPALPPRADVPDEKDETVGAEEEEPSFAEGGSNVVEEPADAGVDEPSESSGSSDPMEAEPYRAADEFIGDGYEGDIAAGADARGSKAPIGRRA